MTEHKGQFDAPEPHIPDRLGKDLQGLFQPPGAVPARVDKAILDQAHRRLAKPRHLVIRLRWAAGIVAAAAVITLGVVLFNPQSRLPRFARNDMTRNVVTPDFDPGPQSARLAPAEGRADIDGNGRVDILDAFRLARSIEARGPADPTRSADLRWDLNGDGRVDKDDVDLVASAAVHLEPGSQARRGEGILPLRVAGIPFAGLRASLPAIRGRDALATNLPVNSLANGV